MLWVAREGIHMVRKATLIPTDFREASEGQKSQLGAMGRKKAFERLAFGGNVGVTRYEVAR